MPDPTYREICEDIAPLIRVAAIPQQTGRCRSILAPFGLFDRKTLQGIQVAVDTVFDAMPRELVRVNLNLPNFDSRLDEIVSVFRSLLEPFIEGVGKVRTKQTPKGFVVFRCD